jgi:hypothetical protein
MRRLLALFAALFLGGMGVLLTIGLSPAGDMGGQGGASALAVLAAQNAKEGQGDLWCGPAGPAGAGASVAAAAAAQAGFAGADLVLAVAVAGAESNWRPDATNQNTNGSTDYGLFQINSVHAVILASGDWRDPYDNARFAKRIHDEAGGWTPWVTFNTGAYLRHLPAARAAVAGAAAVAQPCTATGTGGPQGGNDMLTPATRAMRAAVAGAFPGTPDGCYRAAEDGGEHPRGRACDFMVPVGGAKGDAIALYVQRNAVRLRVMYIIWEQRLWSPARADEGWRWMEDRGSPTQNHMDHVHVSILP